MKKIIIVTILLLIVGGVFAFLVNNSIKQGGKPQAIEYNLMINDGQKSSEIRVLAKDGQTLIDSMDQLKQEGKISFSGKSSQYGFFIEEINGSKQDFSNNLFWMLFINGATSTVGVSEYKIKPQDNIQWSLMKIEGFN